MQRVNNPREEGKKAGEGPSQTTERGYLLLVNLSQKCRELVMLPTKKVGGR